MRQYEICLPNILYLINNCNKNNINIIQNKVNDLKFILLNSKINQYLNLNRFFITKNNSHKHY